MFCNKCGEKLVDTAVFCHKCGQQIEISSSTPPLKTGKKAPDPAFGAKPMSKAVKPAEKPVIPEPVPPSPEPTPEPAPAKAEEEKAEDTLDGVVKILRNDVSEEEEESIFLNLQTEEPQKPKKLKKKGKGAALICVMIAVIAVMVFAALMVILPDIKPFSSIRSALGIAHTPTDSQIQTTSVSEATTIPETVAQSPQPADGTLLDKPVAPDIAKAEKIHINAIVYSESKKLRVEFSVDFSDENETVFYIPADVSAQTPDMIYVLSGSGTYSSYEGGYGHFYAVESDEKYDIENSDIPEALVLPLALLGESYRTDYEGKYEAKGSESLDGTGEAYVYTITDADGESGTVWVDADTGVFVRRINSSGEVFTVTETEVDADVTIPDYKNNIIEE